MDTFTKYHRESKKGISKLSIMNLFDDYIKGTNSENSNIIYLLLKEENIFDNIVFLRLFGSSKRIESKLDKSIKQVFKNVYTKKFKKETELDQYAISMIKTYITLYKQWVYNDDSTDEQVDFLIIICLIKVERLEVNTIIDFVRNQLQVIEKDCTSEVIETRLKGLSDSSHIKNKANKYEYVFKTERSLLIDSIDKDVFVKLKNVNFTSTMILLNYGFTITNVNRISKYNLSLFDYLTGAKPISMTNTDTKLYKQISEVINRNINSLNYDIFDNTKLLYLTKIPRKIIHRLGKSIEVINKHKADDKWWSRLSISAKHRLDILDSIKRIKEVEGNTKIEDKTEFLVLSILFQRKK